jgi:hypothetical protein
MMLTILLEHPALPLGTLLILAAYLLLARGLRRAEDSDNETIDTLVEDVTEMQGRVEAVERKLTEQSNKLTTLSLRGVK